MEKVLILGINGFVGRHFQEYIKDNNLLKKFSFTGVDRVVKEIVGINYKKSDLSDYSGLERLMLKERPGYIINFTGTFNADNFAAMKKVNAGISKNIFEIIIKHALRIKKVLLIGSASEYGLNNHLPLKEREPLNPSSPYGLTKAMQTLYALFYFNNFGVNVNIARTFNLIGKGLSPLLSVGSFARQIKNAKGQGVVYAGNLNSKRDFLNVKDAVSAYWGILLRGRKGEIYNVSSGESFYLGQVLDFLIASSGKKIKIAVKRDRLRKNDIPDSFGDNAKLKKDTGWERRHDIFSALSQMLGN